jgi:predicted esterase
MDTGGAAGTGGVETAGVPGTGNAPGYGGTQGSGGYGAGGYMQSSGGIKGNGGYVGLGGGLGTGGLLGTGGIMIPPGTGGLIGAGGTVGAGGGMNNAGGAAPAGKMDPVIPMVSGDCPTFATGTITFMGLAGIQIASGAKPASPTAPMLFYWHGTGSTSGEYSLMAAPVAQGIQAAGGIIVSFQGSTGGDLLSGTSVFGQGDFKLTDQLAACAVRDRNIDPRKIYTMGCSAGGLFATAMAAMRSTYIAAAAPNSGGTVAPLTFQNAHTPALMTVHGKMGSDVVIVDFSQTSATADTAFKGKGGFVIDCDTGGGHCGGSGLAGDAWKFLQAHTFGIDPEPWTALPAGFSSQCMIK